ncbi:hypothetical protein ES703_80370 [subsurface metagenome]
MELKKAIEIVGHHTIVIITTQNHDLLDALCLLIEAGKWRRQMELDYGSWCGPSLPGETVGPD